MLLPTTTYLLAHDDTGEDATGLIKDSGIIQQLQYMD